MPAINRRMIAPICLLSRPDAGTALPLDLCCDIPLAAEPTLCCLAAANQQLAALPAADPNSTIAALPAAWLLTFTASPAVITVYKTRARADTHASYISFFYGSGRAILKGGGSRATIYTSRSSRTAACPTPNRQRLCCSACSRLTKWSCRCACDLPTRFRADLPATRTRQWLCRYAYSLPRINRQR